MVEFIDQQRDEFDVESICRVPPIASSTYYAAKKRETAPSARAVRDAVMCQILMVLWVANRKVYGAHKLWKAARRAGHDIGRDQVARLMKVMEISSRLTTLDAGSGCCHLEARRHRRTASTLTCAQTTRGPKSNVSSRSAPDESMSARSTCRGL